MSEASEALDLVERTIQQLEEAGWLRGNREVPFPDDRSGAAAQCLFYERAFLMWHVNMELYEGTMVVLDRDALKQAAFDDLPGNLGMGVNAVLASGRDLERVLEELPPQIERVQALLVGPATYFRQIGMESLGMKPKN